MTRKGEPSPKKGKPEARHTPEDRDKAIVLLSEGWSVLETARQVGCSPETLRRWREAPYFREQLARRYGEKKAEIEAALENARAQTKAALPLVLDKIVREALDPKVKGVALANLAKLLFDRLGLPAVSKVDVTAGPSHDLSKLTDEELRTWEALQQKAALGPTKPALATEEPEALPEALPEAQPEALPPGFTR